MRTVSALAGSALFLLVAPGSVAGLVPWLIVHAAPPTTQTSQMLLAFGGFMVAAGIGALLQAFLLFALDGRGTPAPVAPTDTLVVTGTYRHVRNPMYVAVVAIIFGQALLFANWAVFAYGLIAWATMAAFVRLYEEPTLQARYGARYDAYRQAVPAWLPRLTPWTGGPRD